MSNIFKKIGRRLSRSFHEKESFLLAVQVEMVMYGPGSKGVVKNGQQIFVSVRRNTEKTMLVADGCVSNGTVHFLNAAETMKVTLYNADTGYQQKHFKITLSSVMGDQRTATLDVAQFVNCSDVGHQVVFPNDFAIAYLVISLVRDYSDVMAASTFEQFAHVAHGVVDESGQPVRSKQKPEARSREAAEHVDGALTEKGLTGRSRALLDFLPLPPESPKVWANLALPPAGAKLPAPAKPAPRRNSAASVGATSPTKPVPKSASAAVESFDRLATGTTTAPTAATAASERLRMTAGSETIARRMSAITRASPGTVVNKQAPVLPKQWDGKRMDPKTGRFYYYNKSTKETQWVEVVDAKEVTGSQQDKAAKSAAPTPAVVDLTKFERMVTAGVPLPGVRQKMIMSKIPMATITAFCKKHQSRSQTPAQPKDHTLVPEEAKTDENARIMPTKRMAQFQEFIDMLKNGIPPPAVRQRMIMARVPPNKIDGFFRDIKQGTSTDGVRAMPTPQKITVGGRTWDGKRRDPKTGQWYYYNKTTRATMWVEEASGQQPTQSSQQTLAQPVAESDSFKKFKKMLTMGVPPPAVRQKMIMARLSAEDIAAVLGGVVETQAPQKTEGGTECPEFEKFGKMLDMGVPPPAVRQKMIMAQIPADKVDAFFQANATPSGDQQTASAKTASIALGPELDKFKKMLAMGIPPPAVRQKMIMAQISSEKISAVLGGSTQGGDSKPKRPPPKLNLTGVSVTAAPQPKMSLGPEFDKFKKMLGMGIPAPAVRQKMMMAQLPTGQIDAFFANVGGGTDLPPGSTGDKPKNTKPKSNMTNLHWDKIETIPESSIWATVTDVQNSPTAKTKNIERLKNLFTKSSGRKSDAKGKGSANDSKKAGKHNELLDGKRAHNIEIGLAQFRTFSNYIAIVEAVCYMDSKKLGAEKVATLVDISPTTEDTKAAKRYRGGPEDIAALSKASKWILDALTVPNFSKKCKMFLYSLQFNDAYSSMTNRIATITNVCRGVMGSVSLKAVLGSVLEIGNAMNQGTHAGGARGFKLDSLLKLSQTKSHDKKTTVLDFLVESEAEHGVAKAGLWVGELQGMDEAARLGRKELNAEFMQLQSGMEQIKREGGLELTEGDAENEKAFRIMCQRFATKEDRRIKMLRSVLDEMGNLCDNVSVYFGEEPSKYDVTKAFRVLSDFSKLYERSLKAFTERQARRRRMSKGRG